MNEVQELVARFERDARAWLEQNRVRAVLCNADTSTVAGQQVLAGTLKFEGGYCTQLYVFVALYTEPAGGAYLADIMGSRRRRAIQYYGTRAVTRSSS